VLDRYRFRVPSLRNIERTPPYMHDGRFKRLKDVLLFYATPSMRAGHADVRMRDMPAFDERQRKDLLAFLLTLTDETFLRDSTLGDPWRPR
jgi:cytochrome c peroxidase